MIKSWISQIDQKTQICQIWEGVYHIRVPKTIHAESPFIYLMLINGRAYVQDTGPVSDEADFPLKEIIGEAISLAGHDIAESELIVYHTHSHGDHIGGDPMFKNSHELIPPGIMHLVQAFDLKAFCQIEGKDVYIDPLGELIFIPIPGHDRTTVATYHVRSGILFPSDTLYPGRIYIHDWKEFKLSIQRLVSFSEKHAIRAIYGTHIEISKYPYQEFVDQTLYQPEEHDLRLSLHDLHQLHCVCSRLPSLLVPIKLPNLTLVPVSERFFDE